jgi:hypothetical protein
MRWKIATYISLEPSRELWRQKKPTRERLQTFCQKVRNRTWYHYTDCGAFGQYRSSKTKYIDNLKDLVAEYWVDDNQESNRRFKRGVLHFVREISKLLFGTLTQSDTRAYNKRISKLEKEPKDFFLLSKEQITVIKTTSLQ